MPVDPIQFRLAMRRFATGVTVVTVRDGDKIHGMTANSFTSVSLSPTLILICVMNASTTLEMISRAHAFAVNVLSAAQRPWAERFAKQIIVPGDPFENIRYHAEATGAPIFDDCIAYLDCTLTAAHPAGDHTIIVGEVKTLGYGSSRDAAPLLWLDGKYAAVAGP